MSFKIPFPPGQIKILKALETSETKKRVSKSYTMLKEETGLPDPVLSDYLKKLRKKKLVERDIDTREYYLSIIGKRKWQMLTLIERLMDIIERENTKPVTYKSEKLGNVKLASETKKNLRMLANCTLELHKAFLQLPKVQKLFGHNPFVRTTEQSDGTILLDFKKYEK
jgi:DNA-binding HxlR family transcriptional regulator